MTLDADDWARVNDAFHRALDLAPEARDAFVRQACGDDAAACEEVRSLLAAHDRAGGFLEQPAGSAGRVLASLDHGHAAIGIGETIGHYRIERSLGEGGMGVVYVAQDLRLGRSVALKALPARFTDDPARRERLRREARAAAGLTHPGIATVYALEEFDGRMFIAHEFVPGDTLRDELRRGPLGVDLAIDTAMAIVDAVGAAHEAGVVHRDLKPENIIRTPAGEIRVLDFGLARVRDRAEDLAHLTASGVVVGTPAYMSPEQIRHPDVDARSDLFSIGVMLHEFVAGTNPFLGEHPASTMANIIEARPVRLDGSVARDARERAVLGEYDAIVRKCLEKSPDARFHSARELRAALERARAGPQSALAVEVPPDVPAEAAGVRASGPVWWWQFHQIATSVAYGALLAPLWLARGWTGGRAGLLVALAGIVGAAAAVTLRLHLSFVLRCHPSEWARQCRQTGPWIRLADVLFVLGLGTAGLLVMDGHPAVAAILVGAAVTALLSFLIIEPSTMRAAGRDV